MRTIHCDHYLIVLNRKIDQIMDCDLFHGVLLICDIGEYRRMVEALDIEGLLEQRSCQYLSGDIFAMIVRRD